MILLCIESSANPTVVGLVKNEKVIAEAVIETRDQLPDEIRNLFSQTGLTPKDITAVALSIGPGSFTGLRVGAAFAKGFARAVACPIWPVPSLQIFAANFQGKSNKICAISSARKGSVHWGLFHGQTLENLSPEKVVLHEDLIHDLNPDTLLVGPGVFSLSPELRAKFVSQIPQDEILLRAQSSHLARLAYARWCDKTPPAINDILPVYGLEFGA